MKNSSDAVGNRTRDVAACSAVPQLRHRMPPMWKHGRAKQNTDDNIIQHRNVARIQMPTQNT